MSSRGVRIFLSVRKRGQPATDVNVTQSENQGDQQVTEQAPMVPQIVSGPPFIDIEAIVDDDDVVESTASAFAQAKNNRGARRGPLVIDVESGSTTTLGNNRTRLRSDKDSGDSVKLNKKSPRLL